MPRRLGLIIAASLLPVAALSVQTSAPEPSASLPGADLLAGCGDIPEVVELVERLRIREDRINKALKQLDDRRAEIETARRMLSDELSRLKANGGTRGASKTHQQQAMEEDIARLVAVYESMKPKEAAEVLSNLPADFSAEILIRVSPETGARIMAAIEPDKAAVLTTYMGARSAPSR